MALNGPRVKALDASSRHCRIPDFGRLLTALGSHDVRDIIVGGFAATAHGSAFLTVDLDGSG